ncbi:polygalacturonase [Fragilaria crotonensis]|nr:polygalacturonase [Fragilaria crotonensis]
MFGSSIVSSRQLILCAFALILRCATGQILNLENFGAVGDGVTDDTVALNSAFSQAPPGSTILIPAGRTYAHNNIVQIGVPDLIVTGGGRLLATNEGRSGVWISADRVVMQNIVLKVKSTTSRWYTYESMKLRLMNCRGVVVRGVTIQGSANLGIHVGNTYNFILDKVVVRNTRAGAIYIAEKSSNGTLLQPQTFNSGDSAIVIQSSRQDGGQVNDIVLQSPAVRRGTKGVAYAILGSRDIVMNDIYAEDSELAALYISAESSTNTYSVSNVTVNGGRLVRSSKNLAASHGSIMIYNGRTSEVIQNITISDVQSVNTTKSLPYEVGIASFGSGGVFWVEIRNMNMTRGPSQAFYSQAPLSSYRTFHWIKDGRMLRDLIGYGEAYPTFTPEQYGAVGDGVTDDTVALNTLFSQAPPGATIRISSGKTYAHNDIVAMRVPALVIKGVVAFWRRMKPDQESGSTLTEWSSTTLSSN